MIQKSPQTNVFLTGGMGNQLFQLAAALELAKSENVVIFDKIGRPRLNEFGRPEIESFLLPKPVIVKKVGRNNRFISKVIGFNLRSGFKPTRFEENFKPLIKVISNVIVSFYLFSKMRISNSTSLGFDEKVDYVKSNTLLVGYFQTAIYIERLGRNKFVSFPNTRTKKVEMYFQLSRIEKPLIVHVRLGDYANEDELGILSKSYYESALREIWDESRYGNIWLFSEQPELAIEKIPKFLVEKVRLIEPDGLSSLETLEIMTFGSGYIIANSSFSWWGAYMRKLDNAVVCCPQPWFKALEEPKNIVPTNWMRVNGFDSLR